MGRTYAELDDKLVAFITAQPVFFVATAPSAGGHVNVSPKGYADTFAVLGPRTVAYLDLTGSGVETVAHLRDNGRVTVMFCAFAGPPKIVRLYGTGRVVVPGDVGWDELAAGFGPRAGVRAVVLVEVERVADSCGHAVPLMQFDRERDVLSDWHRHKGEDTLVAYRAERNAASIDGLPGLPGLPGPAGPPGAAGTWTKAGPGQGAGR
jgi:hypothetical protein